MDFILLENFRDTTFINPFGLVSIFIGGLYILCATKERLLPAFIIGTVMIPLAQRVVIFGLDFTLMRIFILVIWLRLILRREVSPIKINNIDKLIILWVILRIINYTILWQTVGALVNRLGSAYDTLGLYFLFRLTIKKFEDIDGIIKTLAFICLILLIFVGIEIITKHNIFATLGGVPEITEARDGKLRCQGPFNHPIMLGSFCGSLVPIFIFYRGQENRRRWLFLMAAMAAIVITVATASSGPVLTLFAGLIGLGLWPFRRSVRLIRWGILMAIIFLHLVMKAPVWALLNRVKIFGASTGYHRLMLFSSFVDNLDEWWLWGGKSPGEWGEGLHDLTNWFVRVGVDGGLISVIILIWIILLCFWRVEQVMMLLDNSKNMQKIVWSIGASLFAHFVSFFGVSYFDQIIVLWYLLIGTISSLVVLVRKDIVSVCPLKPKRPIFY